MNLVQAGICYARTQVRAPAGTGPLKTPEPTTGLFRLLSDLQLHLAQAIHDHNREPTSPLLGPAEEPDTAFLQRASDRFLERIVALYCLQDLLGQRQPIQRLGASSAAFNSRGYDLQKDLLRYCSHIHRRCGAALFSPGHIFDAVRVPDYAISDLLHALGEVSWSTWQTDVLGRIHSFLLGRRLVVQSGSVSVEKDPFPRKSGGVYYTPSHIVRYMVDRTLGRWLHATIDGRPDGEPSNDTRPKSMADVVGNGQQGGLRVLDPAMGSGAFLCYAFAVLADFYSRADPTGTTREHMSRIMHEHLYGIDVDAAAVALAEVNLLISAAEYSKGKGEPSDYVPIATTNLRVGNSLISGSTGEQRLSSFVAPRRRLVSLRQQMVDSANNQAYAPSVARAFAADKNQLDLALNESLQAHCEHVDKWQPFNWEIEFPEVFDPNLPEEERGFTVVVGNPPYVFGEHIPVDEKPYLESHYEMARGQYDLYWLFYERSIDLLKDGGHHSFVVPDAVTVRDEAKCVREMLIKRGQLGDIACVGAAFPEPEVSAVVTVWQKSKKGTAAVNIDHLDSAGLSSTDQVEIKTLSVPPSYRFPILVPSELLAVFALMKRRSDPLSDHMSISRGEELGKRGLHRLEVEAREGHIPILVGEDVSNFEPCRPQHSIEEDSIRKGKALYHRTKIVVVKTGRNLKATLDSRGFCTLQSLYNLIPRRSSVDLRALLAIMLSTPLQVYLWRTFTGYKSIFPQITQSHLGQLPIPRLEASGRGPTQPQKALTQLAQRMLDLSEVRRAVLNAAATMLSAGSQTSSSLRSYIRQHDGLVDFQPLLDSTYEGDVNGIAVEERADSLLVRVRIAVPDSAAPDSSGIGRGEDWRDAARLTMVDPELRVYILIALKEYLDRRRCKRVWSRGKVVDGALQTLKIPQLPAAAVAELLARVRGALPAELPHHAVGLDKEGAPLNLTCIEDDLHATRSEIDQHVYGLFGLAADEQAALDIYRHVNI